MTRRERVGLYYLPEAALTLRVSWVVFEKALYHPAVRPQLTRLYRKRWGHPRRVRVLTGPDLDALMAHLLTHCRMLKPFGISGSVKRNRRHQSDTRILHARISTPHRQPI